MAEHVVKDPNQIPKYCPYCLNELKTINIQNLENAKIHELKCSKCGFIIRVKVMPEEEGVKKVEEIERE